jgi:hypothetical protein
VTRTPLSQSARRKQKKAASLPEIDQFELAVSHTADFLEAKEISQWRAAFEGKASESVGTIIQARVLVHVLLVQPMYGRVSQECNACQLDCMNFTVSSASIDERLDAVHFQAALEKLM